MQIRLAKNTDIPLLASLEYQHYKAEGYPEAFLFQAFRQWPKMLWIAESKATSKDKITENNSICGYVLAAPGEKSNQAWIMSALISPDSRGQGLGAALMQHAIEELTLTGFNSIQLSVAPENTSALKLYEKLGFRITEHKNDYLGSGEHRLIMCFKACSGST